ncbi:hypothetical protein DL771_004746 [Monosporascus sp. 5C6A]|nr:hypothetical protein DL771_004746 [Monosporascus sp. 5C6A]
MATIAIQLPYTKGPEVLQLTTDKHCYAKEAKLAGTVIEEARRVIGRAREVIGRNREEFNVANSANIPHMEVPTGTNIVANDVKRAVNDAVEAVENAVKIKIDASKPDNAGQQSAYEETFVRAYTNATTKIDEATEATARVHQAGVRYDKAKEKTVLVVGGGVSGLMTAWILLDKGHRVSIVAKDWAETGTEAKGITSQIAGALWEYPPGSCGLSEIEVPVLAYSKLEQYQEWAMQSFLFYERLQTVAGTASGSTASGSTASGSTASGSTASGSTNLSFGARMINLYQFFHHNYSNEGTATAETKAGANANEHYQKYIRIRDLGRTEGSFRDKLQTSIWDATGEPNGSGEWVNALAAVNSTGFGLKWGYRHRAPVIDTDAAMKFLMELVRDKGAVLETREIKGDLHLHERELMDDFQADIIVNASGLGAHTLANDDQIFPVRGAVKRMNMPHPFLEDNAVLLPAQYDIADNPSKTIFIVPRREDTLVVGSIIQRNNWDLSLTHQSPEVMAMWERAKEFITHLQENRGLGEDERPLAQGLRPFSHSNVRVSADNRTNSCRVVHNYGHGGSGWTLAVGCAWTCVKLVEMILHEGKSGSVANTEVWGLKQY